MNFRAIHFLCQHCGGNRYGFFRVTQQWHAPRTKTIFFNYVSSVGKMHGEREKDNLSLIGSNTIEVLTLTVASETAFCATLETVPDVYIPPANK